jgi:hypothetical protein
VRRRSHWLPRRPDDLDRQRHLPCLRHASGRFGCRLQAYALSDAPVTETRSHPQSRRVQAAAAPAPLPALFAPAQDLTALERFHFKG